jgi:hypothetical protein
MELFEIYFISESYYIIPYEKNNEIYIFEFGLANSDDQLTYDDDKSQYSNNELQDWFNKENIAKKINLKKEYKIQLLKILFRNN